MSHTPGDEDRIRREYRTRSYLRALPHLDEILASVIGRCFLYRYEEEALSHFLSDHALPCEAVVPLLRACFGLPSCISEPRPSVVRKLER